MWEGALPARGEGAQQGHSTREGGARAGCPPGCLVEQKAESGALRGPIQEHRPRMPVCPHLTLRWTSRWARPHTFLWMKNVPWRALQLPGPHAGAEVKPRFSSPKAYSQSSLRQHSPRGEPAAFSHDSLPCTERYYLREISHIFGNRMK